MTDMVDADAGSRKRLQTWIFNPFHFLAGGQALALGLAFIFAAGLLGWTVNGHLDGVLDFHVGRQAPVWLFLVEGFIDWLSLALVLWGVSKLAKIAKLDPEIGRKLVHISLGLYCLTFPYVFGAVWEVVATCGLAVLVFLLARGTMRESLGGGLHAVKRVSYGELLFAVSVALLFWLKDGHFVSLALHLGSGRGRNLPGLMVEAVGG